MEILLLFLEKVCEALYFSLFLLYGKNIKEKRLLFIGIMIFEYLTLTTIFQYNIWIHILYTFMSFVNLKVLYKQKAQITDIFLFMLSSIILILISSIAYFLVYFTISNYIFSLILARILLFSFLYFIKNKIYIIYKSFYKLWNKHNNKNKIKSITLRNISIIIFNLMFWLLNIALTISLLIGMR